MLQFLRTRVAARSTAIILTLVGLVGVASIGIVIPLSTRHEEAAQHARLNELLDAVERTVSIACFVGDKNLAEEVVKGLLQSPVVDAVSIRTGESVLAESSKPSGNSPRSAAAADWWLRRPIHSPFNQSELIGEIRLAPDVRVIGQSVNAAAQFIGVLLAAQVAVAGLGVAAIVLRLIIRPIATISHRMHRLRAETGEKLAAPRGNELDEIGQLVADVNVLIDNLVHILNKERTLRVERELEERRLRAIFDHADTGIFVMNDRGEFLSSNPAFEQLLDLSSAVSANVQPSLANVNSAFSKVVSELLAECTATRQSIARDIKISGGTGAPGRWVNVILSRVEDKLVQGIVNDVTDRKRAEDAAQERAVTDPLTDLSNRLGFELRIEALFEDRARHREPGFTLVMLDLDWFKAVNDTYGHQAGDLVLVEVAKRLKGLVRGSDFVARLGGDEFLIILTGTTERTSIEGVAQHIIERINEPIIVAPQIDVHVGASLGVAICNAGEITPEALLEQADRAMYQAKQCGRNSYHMFEPCESKPRGSPEQGKSFLRHREVPP